VDESLNPLGEDRSGVARLPERLDVLIGIRGVCAAQFDNPFGLRGDVRADAGGLRIALEFGLFDASGAFGPSPRRTARTWPLEIRR
jgi:hypothetical protein